MNSTGWAGSERVNTSDGRDTDHDPVEVAPRVSGFDWPSEDAPAVWVEFATADEASEVASFAREQLMGWLAGGGLHPVSVAYRWVIACCFLRIDRDAGLVKGVMAVHGKGLGLGKWERLVMESIKPAMPWMETLRRIDSNIADSALMGRYAGHGVGSGVGDDRSIAEVLDWVAEEGIELPFSFSEVEVEGIENDAREIGRASMRLMCRWLSLSGPDLLSVLQRFYGMAFERYKMITGKMTGEDLSDLVLQVRATFCEMMKRYFAEPGEVLLGYVPKTAGQKSAKSSAVYAANAAANCPRRQLGGDAGLGREVRESATDADGVEVAADEEAASGIAADWVKAGRWLGFAGELKDRNRIFGLMTVRQLEIIEVIKARDAEAFKVTVLEGGAQS